MKAAMFGGHWSLLDYALATSWVGAPMCFYYASRVAKTHPDLAIWAKCLEIILGGVALSTLSRLFETTL